MPYCTYHSMNPAGAECSRCARPLCSACDHRIRGFPFCQNCIVAGVELLQHQSRLAALPSSAIRRRSSPVAAAVLSLVPGLGAAYNGQTSKAVVHFAVYASFFQLATSTRAPFFVWGIICTWLFAMVDAYRTAQLIRVGLVPAVEEDLIARRLHSNPLAWGVILAMLGAALLGHTLFGVKLPIRELFPVALVTLGAYMIFDYARYHKRQAIAGGPIPAYDSDLPNSSPFNASFSGDEPYRTSEFVTRSVSVRPSERRP